ncbi:MAG: hypothetical protein D6679_13980, partial [Candidatus Hydrogenedentota bacterium]
KEKGLFSSGPVNPNRSPMNSDSRSIGSLSVDMDSFRSLFGVRTRCPDPGWTVGLERILDLFSSFSIHATFFVVGWDFEEASAREGMSRIVEEGHEVAVHSWSHPQGWSRLNHSSKQREIEKTSDLIEELTGRRPRGFRAPGWNIDEETLEILEQEGFLYDSSLFPTSLSPLLKLLYGARTRFSAPTLGRLSFVLAPSSPYSPGKRCWRAGRRNLLEIPLSVTPRFRLPLHATFLLARIVHHIPICPAKPERFPGLNFAFHAADFYDLSDLNSVCLAAANRTGYCPLSLRIPWATKKRVFFSLLERALSRIRWVPLEERRA